MHRESSGVRFLPQEDGKVAITSVNERTKEIYLALFNNSETSPVDVTVNLADLKLKGIVRITKLWSVAKMGIFKDHFTQKLNAHASGLYLITATE